MENRNEAGEWVPPPVQPWSHDGGPHGSVTLEAGELIVAGGSLVSLHGWDDYLQAALDSHRDIDGVRDQLEATRRALVYMQKLVSGRLVLT
jgi:hypothetical protein